MSTVEVYGPPTCPKCTFTIRKLNAGGVEATKVTVEDSLHPKIVASKKAIKAEQLGIEAADVKLTEDELIAPKSAPFVWVNDAFAWHDLVPGKIDELVKRKQQSSV